MCSLPIHLMQILGPQSSSLTKPACWRDHWVPNPIPVEATTLSRGWRLEVLSSQISWRASDVAFWRQLLELLPPKIPMKRFSLWSGVESRWPPFRWLLRTRSGSSDLPKPKLRNRVSMSSSACPPGIQRLVRREGCRPEHIFEVFSYSFYDISVNSS